MDGSSELARMEIKLYQNVRRYIFLNSLLMDAMLLWPVADVSKSKNSPGMGSLVQQDRAAPLKKGL